MREIVLDTETTGLDPKQGHRVIEIGALEMVNKVVTGKKFHTYINPDRDVPFEAYNVHGISTDFLRDKPRFHEIAAEFVEFIEGSSLVIHNASFDMGFLNYELMKIGKNSLSHFEVIDTLSMARRKFPGQKNNLDALCKRFKVDNSDRKYHGALKDALLLSEVYVELTGGRQININLSISTGKSENMELQTNSISNNFKFKVQKASEEELRIHNEFMNNIKK